MKQILFVLKKGQIAFWKYSRGSLSHGTLNGNRWNDFTPSYWEEWSEANQAGDSVDAILLADEPNAFGTLPDWLQERSDASAWTIALLGKLAKDAQFDDKGLVLSQGEAKFTLADGDAPGCYLLISSLKFTLPTEEPKKEEVKPEPVQNTLDVRKFKADVFLLSQSDRQFKIGDKCIGKFYKLSVLKDAVYLRIDGVDDLAKLNLRSERTISHPHEESVVWDAGKAVELCVVNVDERRVYFEAKV